MSTKEKILDKALELFNQKGVETVTTRQIALALDMSQGNLCYHFPKKEAIIRALYEQLIQKFNDLYLAFSSPMSTSVEENPSLQLNISTFLKMIQVTNQYFVDYKFLMLNFVQIMRWYPTIRTHYQALTKQRNEQTMRLFHGFQAAGLLKMEAYTGQYQQIIEQFMIINNFWLSHAEILYQKKEAEKIDHFNQLVAAFIFPYLTTNGQKEYRSTITN